MTLTTDDVRRIEQLATPAAVQRAVRIGAARRESIQRHIFGEMVSSLEPPLLVNRLVLAVDIAIREATRQGLVRPVLGGYFKIGGGA